MKQAGRQLGQDDERKGGFCLGSSCRQAARSGRGRSGAGGWNTGCPKGAQEGSHWVCWEAQALPEGLVVACTPQVPRAGGAPAKLPPG